MSTANIPRFLFSFKQKMNLIERGKRKFWPLKYHQRRKNSKLLKFLKISKTSWFKTDPRCIFNFFVGKNTSSSLTYLEFRSWILLIDRTLTEVEILQIFNDIDRNHDNLIQYKEFENYFGNDFLTSQPSLIDLTILFNEIDRNQTGYITLNELLAFVNHQSMLITREEGEIFLGNISDYGNENSISSQEFLRAMLYWNI